MNLETAIEADKVIQNFDLEPLLIGGDHSQRLKAPPIKRGSKSKGCVNLSASTAVSRFKLLRKMRLKSRRPQLILEVLIAFMLILIAFFPLITPHIVMLREYKQFTSKVVLNHLVNLIYVDILEQMYLGEIEWYQLDEKRDLKIKSRELEERLKKLPYKSHYKITDLKPNKSTKDGSRTLYLMTLTLTFEPDWKGTEPISYNYKVVVDKTAPGSATLESEELNIEDRLKDMQKQLEGKGFPGSRPEPRVRRRPSQ